jgi:peroxiredoxin Q/BCP
MPVELRKRKAHQEAPPAPVRPAKKKAPAKGKKADSEKTVVEQVQEAAADTVEAVKKPSWVRATASPLRQAARPKSATQSTSPPSAEKSRQTMARKQLSLSS